VPDEWTIATLKVYVERILHDHAVLDDTRHQSAQAALSIAVAQAKEAVLKAEAATEKRLEGLNEFRASLTDNQRTLIPRAEAEIRFAALADRIDVLTRESEERRGQRSGLSAGWSVALAVFGLISLAASILLAFKR